MADNSYNIMVSNPVTPFTMSRSFKACSNGKIFIGIPDTDPTLPQNQIPVYVESESGTTVQVSQPIIINSAGYPVYNGQISKFVTTQNYSMAVYDSYMVQQFYWPDLSKINPEIILSGIRSPFGASYIGEVDSYESLKKLTPEYEGQVVLLRSYYKDSQWAVQMPQSTGAGKFRAVNLPGKEDNGTKAVVSATWYWQRVFENNVLTPQMFGGAADFDTSTKTGTDNTKPFQDAVDSAISYRNMRVEVMSGYYYKKGETILSGSDYMLYVDVDGEFTRDIYNAILRGSFLQGSGMDSTTIVFDAASEDVSCFSVRKGWGTSSSRGISDLTVVPFIAKPDSSETAAAPIGNAIELQGCCYSVVRNVRAYQLKRCIWLNNRDKNDFTEFNWMENVFSDHCAIAGDYYVSLGNNSFHGNKWINCMVGVRHFGGIAFRGYDDQSRGTSESNYTYLAYIYNNVFNVSIYGAATTTQGNHYAFHLTRAVVETAVGDIIAEGILLFHATSWEWFRSEGTFQSIGSTTFESGGDVDTSKAPINFVFSNISPAKAVSGTDSVLNTNSLLVQIPDRTLKSITGQRLPLRVRGKISSGATTESTLFATPASDKLGHLFARYNSDTSILGDVVVKWQLNADGNQIKATDSSYLGLANKAGAWAISGYSLAPGADAAGNIGSASLRPSTVFAVNSTIATSDATLKSDPRAISDTEISAFYEIGQLPWVWTWLAKQSDEGDTARLHSGPTVQAAIAIMTKYSLDWTLYGAFCYDEWEAADAEYFEDGTVKAEAVTAGSRYSFRKEELLLWILRATISKQTDIDSRLTALEGK
ncbi:MULTISPECIES: phage tailspike protein [unclassified Tatumella]|uniref:phage tailspike protein n=1 Tax=unclassified Tatumella TaxID=2649542 RepID=UPI001BB04A7C|nr:MULTISPECIES: phage tailspike protein [unclassified Tatumella]MBS0857226.1 hypothetical protein [Tatumella sp. JGM16]MBS0913979.1 hypothetical protein [Tatumella sp. JGM91]